MGLNNTVNVIWSMSNVYRDCVYVCARVRVYVCVVRACASKDAINEQVGV